MGRLKFNGYIKLLIYLLAARGETFNDLLTIFFKGYSAAMDKPLVDYISCKQERYKEGEQVPPDTLMEQANSKYNMKDE
jgi:hypothetical protein